MIRVFLTGASGFIGRAVQQELLRILGQEDRIFSLIRKQSDLRVEDERIVTLIGNLETVGVFAENILASDYIIHIAGNASLHRGNNYTRSNVLPTQHLVNIAQGSNRLKRFIYVSSVAAMDRLATDVCAAPLTVDSPCVPRTPYGQSKLHGEEAVLQGGIPYTILRPGFVYGQNMRGDSHLRKFALLIKRGVPLHRIDCSGLISLIHVDDLAFAIARCVTSRKGQNAIYLAETESMKLGAVFSLLGRIMVGGGKWRLRLSPLAVIIVRIHGFLPVTLAGMLLNYYWMDDPGFRADLIDPSRQKSLTASILDVVEGIVESRGG